MDVYVRVYAMFSRELGGVSADEAIRRLLDEHWEAAALAVVERCRTSDPQGWADYLTEADELSAAEAAPADEWSTG